MSGMKLSQSMAQSQVFTPQMQQALTMLQAPAMELRTLVQQELSQNPVLEDILDKPQDYDDPSDAVLDAKIEQMRALDEDTRAFHTSERQGLGRHTKEDEERRQFFFDSLVESETLAQHLEQQFRLATSQPHILAAGEQIIGNLDTDGFLRTSLEEIVTTSNLPLQDLTDALHLLQTFHPVGVAARDLQECLMIQLDRLGKSEELEAVIVSRHLNELAHHRYDLIAKALKIEAETVRTAAAFIATLDPKPGRAFVPEERQNIVAPEVFITKESGEWTVRVNDDAIPRLRISNEYKDMLAVNGDQGELRSYLREKIRSGKSLIQCIQQRQQTIQKIAQEIVRRQVDFLEQGVSSLKPLTLAQVAAEVGVHETTVSRAIANKYVQVPWGIFEMKFFFTPGYQNASGESVSNKSIKDALEEIVAKEDPRKPYSDEEIVKIFGERGVKLARRTIAKYRAELKILPSSLRRVR